MNRIVVYTAIFGNYSALIEQPKFDNVDYVCFTDQPLKSKSWKVVVMEKNPFGDDHTRNNRYFKLLPHLHFPEYVYSVYIDANFIMKKNPQSLVYDCLTEDISMACFDHAKAVRDPRNCIYKEFDAIMELAKVKAPKDDPEIMKAQIDFLRSNNYPENNGLIVGGVLVRRHNDPLMKKVSEGWWDFVKNRSKRDQLSFNYVAWKNNFRYNVIPGDIRRGNDYVYFLGIHKNDISFDLLKYRLRRFFRIV